LNVFRNEFGLAPILIAVVAEGQLFFHEGGDKVQTRYFILFRVNC